MVVEKGVVKMPVKPTQAEINRALYGKKSNKYRNEPTDGYPSKKHAKVGKQLQILANAGAISDLRREVKYVLVPKQKGTLRDEEALSYVADFVWVEGGILHVADVKGFKTPLYIAKRKLMKWFHGIEIEEL